MRLGLALPQFDFSVPGESPLKYDTIVDVATRAEGAGFDSVWLADHLFFDIGKYGGSSEFVGAFEPLVTLAALARDVPRVRIGTLVLCEALRPATVLAKALASLDRVSGGRLDVGLGAGWYEPEYEAIGMEFPRPGIRLERLTEALSIVTAMLEHDANAVTVEGKYHRAIAAVNLPGSLQSPRPPVFVGGKGDRLLKIVAGKADGWNTCWTWTPDAYRDRCGVLERECDRIGRDPRTVWRSLGLYALVGESEADLVKRFDAMRESAPPGVLDNTDLASWREGRLVGTVDQVAEQIAQWRDLGVETLIVGPGVVPFHIGDIEQIELASAAFGLAVADSAAR